MVEIAAHGGRTPTVTVVIPVRNGAATLGDQLAALSAQDSEVPWNLVIADNGSTDGTRAVVERWRSALPPVTVVAADHAVGINAARNAGIAAASAEVILLCDADDVVQPGWIDAHVAALRSSDLCGGPLDVAALNTAHVAEFSRPSAPDGPPVACRFLPYAFGGNLGMWRRVWEAVGGFDEQWVRGSTEIEFCWRAQLVGFSLGWAPDAVVAYRLGPSMRHEVRRRFRSARSAVRLYAQFRARGVPTPSIAPALRAWAWLAYRSPGAVIDPRRRRSWLQVAAWRAGLVAGSIRYRVLYL